MSAIGRGDYVECLKDGTKPGFRKGALYRIREVYPERRCRACGRSHGGLNFEGMPSPHELGRAAANAWPSCRFKPIYPGGALTKLLMQPVDLPADPDFTPAKEDA